jgi:hypothetical protein
MGKWQLLSDSTMITGYDTFPSLNSFYQGQPGDYYDFRNNGYLYTQEGMTLDSMAFEIKSNGSVGCTPSPGFTDAYNTSFITANQAILTVTGITIKGSLYKVVHLSR